MSPLRRISQTVGKDKKIPIDSRRIEGEQTLRVSDPVHQELILIGQTLREMSQTLKMIGHVLGAPSDINE